jgi:Asp/Glu/hydantoin racemase
VIHGGFHTYGQVAGILMLEGRAPRIPGDPGHAQTFDFPVAYGVVRGLPFSDLVEGSEVRLELVIRAARTLQDQGVSFVAADCGLFVVFQAALSRALDIPFIGSALSLVPLLQTFLPVQDRIGLLVGHTGLLGERHYQAAGIDPDRVLIAGMEEGPEFRRVVLQGATDLDPSAMAADVRQAARRLARQASEAKVRLGAVVLECTNLISFADAIREETQAPVFDLANLMTFFASGYLLRPYAERYVGLPSRQGQ